MREAAMITPLLKLALEPIISRHRLVRMLAWSAALLLVFAFGVWVWKATGHRAPVPVLVVLAYLLGWRVPKMIANRWSLIARDLFFVTGPWQKVVLGIV